MRFAAHTARAGLSPGTWWVPAVELLTDDPDFARELRDFSRLEPVDASPIAATKAQEFFYALQVYGV